MTAGHRKSSKLLNVNLFQKCDKMHINNVLHVDKKKNSLTKSKRTTTRSRKCFTFHSKCDENRTGLQLES